MDKFFKDQPENNFKINNIPDVNPTVLRDKTRDLDHSYLAENEQYSKELKKLKDELDIIDDEWMKVSYEFEEMYDLLGEFNESNPTLIDKKRELDSKVKEMEEKEMEIVHKKLEARQELIERMIRRN